MATNKKTFEEQLKELQETVDTLRKPDLTLNESMELYKKGIALVKLCSKELNIVFLSRVYKHLLIFKSL